METKIKKLLEKIDRLNDKLRTQRNMCDYEKRKIRIKIIKASRKLESFIIKR